MSAKETSAKFTLNCGLNGRLTSHVAKPGRADGPANALVPKDSLDKLNTDYKFSFFDPVITCSNEEGRQGSRFWSAFQAG